MKPSENSVFAAFILVVAASGLVFYGYEAAKEDARKGEAVASTTSAVKETTTSSTSTTATTSTTTSTATTSTQSAPTSTTEPNETSTTLEATTTTESSTTTTHAPYDQFGRFRGKGYRVAYLDVKYLCPSCVPVVVATVSQEPGVLSKSLSYRQDISWVVYNPKTVKLERIVELSGASGGAEILNDTVI
jgi:hypothetical protein